MPVTRLLRLTYRDEEARVLAARQNEAGDINFDDVCATGEKANRRAIGLSTVQPLNYARQDSNL